MLSPVHFRHFRYCIAGTFMVRSLCYCLYIFGTLSLLLPVHFQFTYVTQQCHEKGEAEEQWQNQSKCYPITRSHNLKLSPKPIRRECDKHVSICRSNWPLYSGSTLRGSAYTSTMSITIAAVQPLVTSFYVLSTQCTYGSAKKQRLFPYTPHPRRTRPN